MTVGILQRLLWAHERQAAKAGPVGQQPLPFGDGWLDDDKPVEYHGTNVGLARHADRGESLCPPCQAWIDELIAAGYAARLEVS